MSKWDNWNRVMAGLGAYAPASKMKPMLAARRLMLDSRVQDGVSTFRVPRYIPESGVPDEWDEFVAAHLRNITGEEREAAQAATDMMSGGSVLGAFSPTPEGARIGVASYPVGNYPTRRHEIMHGYTEAARRGTPGMPLISRAAASLPDFLGRPLDEAAAQVVGGTRLRDIPWGSYADFYHQQGLAGPARVAAALDVVQGVGRELPEAAVMVAPAAAAAGLHVAMMPPVDRNRMRRAQQQAEQYAPPPQYFDSEEEVRRRRRPSPTP